ELQRRAVERALGPRLLLEETDRRLVAVERRAELDGADEGTGPLVVVLAAAGGVEDRVDPVERLGELLLGDEAVDLLPGSLAGRRRRRGGRGSRPHGHNAALLRLRVPCGGSSQGRERARDPEAHGDTEDSETRTHGCHCANRGNRGRSGGSQLTRTAP